MGGGRHDETLERATRAFRATQTREEIFTSRSLPAHLDPKNIKMRESCDSNDNPNSTPIILGLDITGSMGILAEKLAREGLGDITQGIYKRKPVSDPHILIMAIGDAAWDPVPLQATQFEADNRLSEQLVQLYLKGSGGGNNSTESYDLPWWFAANRTKIDSFDKRGVKGKLFTMGDELPPVGVSRNGMTKTFGEGVQSGFEAKDALLAAQETYEVFHIIIQEGSHCRKHLPEVTEAWRALLGKRAILLDNHNHLAQVVISVLQVSEGEDPESVIVSWQEAGVRESVRHALFD